MEARLTKVGTVTVGPGGLVVVSGFEGNENCTCRDVAVLAAVHAIHVLSAELLKTIESPGGGAIAVD